MAAPAAGVVEARTQGGADALQQGLQHRQRQTASRFTIGGLAERLVAKVLKSGHGEVAVENLYHEELNRGDRVEEALAKTIADLAADGGNLPRVENLGKVFLNPPQGDRAPGRTSLTSVNAIRFHPNSIVTSEGPLTRGAHLRMIAKDFASGSWD